MPPPLAAPSSAALGSITRLLSQISGSDLDPSPKPDAPRIFTRFATRLHVIAHQLAANPDATSSPAASTALRGLAGDLEAAARTLQNYEKSPIYILINCKPLCSSLKDLTRSIASWLALLDSPLSSLPDLRKKVADLALDMQNADLKVTENEERVYCTLQKEAEVRETSKAVQSAIIMDLARALGTNSTNYSKLAEQIKLLRSDLSASSTVEERRILMSLEKIFVSWSMEPRIADKNLYVDFEEDAQIPPFRNFLCPLTKEVMKDPVVVTESSQTYERMAIKYWFDRCVEDGRDPTCPVTGQVLNTLDVKPNIGLKGAIEEWVNRNVELQVKSALQCLGEGGSIGAENVERVLDNVYRISEEYPEIRYKVRNAGIVGMVVRMLKDQSKRMGSQMRCKAFMAMHSMAKDEESKIASLVGKMILTNNAKDYIARNGGQILVNMLSSKLEGKESSLKALYNLSTLDDNATILVNLGVLPALTNILFTSQQDEASNLKHLAASTVANIVSNTGHWELSSADKDGHLMQSEYVIHRLLGELSQSSCTCQAAVLQILRGVASSPQASDLAAHLRSCSGIETIIPYLEHAEPGYRSHALRLTNLLSEKLGQVIVEELRKNNRLSLLKEKLLDSQCPISERSEIACILAKLPFSDVEVKTILGPHLLKWAVNNLREQRSSSSGKRSRNARSMSEGLLGLLLHYARSPDRDILDLVQENHFMNIFQEQISNRSHDRMKQLAAVGLKYLSDSSRVLIATGDSEPQPPRGFCIPLVLICGKAPMAPISCSLHGAACEGDSTFCLLKGNAIKPLIDLMNDDNTQVQIAAVEALSTVVSDVYNLKNAAEELEQLGLFDAAICLFKEVRPGELQEKVITMVDKFFRVESIVQLYSTDQELARALVEALRHGTGNTKRHAQDVLTNLRQISGVGGKNSSNSRDKKTNR